MGNGYLSALRLRAAPAGGVIERGTRPLLPLFQMLGALAAVGVVVALGVFRDGGILPAERPLLASGMLAVGLVWSLLWLALRRTPLADVLSDLSLSGRFALGGLAFLAALALLSALWSLAPVPSLWMGLVYAGGVVAFQAGRRLRLTCWFGLPALTVVLAALGATVCWVALVGYGLEWYSYVGLIGSVTHAQGPFGYANALASFVVLTLPATVWIVASSRGGWRARTLAAGAAGLQLWALWLTRSRGAVLALVAAVAFLSLVGMVRWSSRKGSPTWRWVLVGAIGCALVVAGVAGGTLAWQRLRPIVVGPNVLPVSAVGALPEHVEAVGMKPMTTDGFRIKNWMAAGKAVLEKPLLGWGMDTFYEAYGPFKPGAQTRFAHNVVVQHAVELGLLGVVALTLVSVAAMLAGVGAMLRASFRDPSVWVGVSVTAFLMHNLVDLTWYVPALFYLFWICAGGAATVAAVGNEGVPHEGAKMPAVPEEVSV